MKTGIRLHRKLMSRETLGLIKRFRALYLLLIPCIAFLLIFSLKSRLITARLGVSSYGGNVVDQFFK